MSDYTHSTQQKERDLRMKKRKNYIPNSLHSQKKAFDNYIFTTKLCVLQWIHIIVFIRG